METMKTVPNRMYKATVFAMLFEDKKRLLELYNATLENAIYMAVKNDLSFLIDARLSLYEHQSTYSPNLPLRFLLYISSLFSSMTKELNLYGTKPIELPTPQFVVFYNGLQEQPDRKILKLSDLYTVKGECNLELEAVEKAIEECIREGILKEFLEKNKAEARNMSIFEYDQEKHLRQEREEAWEEGRKVGVEAGILQGLEKGLAQGKEQGKYDMLCKLIQKKLNKGKNTAEIAKELEEPEEVIIGILEKL